MEFEVTVQRIEYSDKSFTVEADDYYEAEEKALELAANTEYPRGSSADYEVATVILNCPDCKGAAIYREFPLDPVCLPCNKVIDLGDI